MKIPMKWLAELITVECALEELIQRLAMSGLEVDGVHAVGALPKEVVTARILELSPHPKAEKLTLCRVEAGDAPITVVCGARNMHPDDVVVLAGPGAVLPDGRRIEVVTIRGVESSGMLCSALELGIAESHDGLLILPPETPVGIPFSRAYTGADTVLELSITPNRSDCLSVLGLARELSALFGWPMRVGPPWFSAQLAQTEGDATRIEVPGPSPASLQVDAPELCPHYIGRVLEGVRVGPSPAWLVSRLNAAGLRSINNVVDATNYVLLERGQPLHAFDLDRLGGAAIIVRRGRDGERLLCLDGVERQVGSLDLLICDRDVPIALAGVMGGLHSSVQPSTQRLLLEAAWFLPSSVRASARRAGLHTDASHRFERGVDPEGVALAMEALTRLILRLAGGTVVGERLEARVDRPARAEITLDPQRISRRLGLELPAARMVSHLEALRMQVRPAAEGLRVRPPSWRLDVETEADLSEEIARVEGYQHIPATAPLAPMRSPRVHKRREMARTLVDTLCAVGLDQVIHYTFISPQSLQALRLLDSDLRLKPVRLLNPISEELSVLRPLLLPCLLKCVAHNARRESPDVRLFEVGKVFIPRGEGLAPEEHYRLGVALAGFRAPKSWTGTTGPADLFDLKGVLEDLLRRLRVHDWSLDGGPSEPFLAPAQGAEVYIQGRSIGYFGELHPDVARTMGIDERVMVMEIDLEPLWNARERHVRVAVPPRFPAIWRDLALLSPEALTAGEIEAVVRETAGPLLEAFSIFDVYRGKGVEAGQKSLACRLTFRASDRTLVEEEVAAATASVLEALALRLKVLLRL